MLHRISNLSNSNSFFVFGARGVGKSSLIAKHFEGDPAVLVIDLLTSEWEDKLLINPDNLITHIQAMKKKPSWVVIDEVQKNPKLLDTVHYLIEKEKIKFALTGSSARKLKRGSANLLAGRAFVYELFPFTHLEIGEKFDLESYLAFGGLPFVYNHKLEKDKIQYLKTYTTTYLKEEIQAEQIVRNLKPFRIFLDIAAQSNAKIVNYSAIARDVGVDTKTIQSYFEILQDTHLGILLPSFHQSLRKRQKTNPKFYYFDTGVTRSLNRKINLPLKKSTFEFGDLFEQFIILEVYRLNSYHQKDFQLSYLQTNNQLEVDLVVERPGLPTAMIEIKSTNKIKSEDYKNLLSLKKDNPNFDYFCVSNDPKERLENGVQIIHWKSLFSKIDLI